MAKSKKNQQHGAAMPDASAFVRLIDEGLAEPRDVVDAYYQCLAAAGPQPMQKGDLVQERPQISEPTAEGRLILLHRMLVVLGGDA